MLACCYLRNAPPVLSFWSLPKKKERAAPGVRKKKALAWPQVTTYGQNHIRRHPNVGMSWAFQCSLSLCWTAHRLCFSRTGGSTNAVLACRGRRPRRPAVIYTASRGEERGAAPVRSMTERQRYAWSAATRTCYSGDPVSGHRFPVYAEESRGGLLWSPFFGV